ncbi:hypothetical protein HYU13_04395 [Candidatus Woesearchaeota archaeon]|nr:hypothetical protein [Candidatus Woesearchaeota archaeon]
MDLINRRIGDGKKPTKLFIDKEILKMGLVRRDAEGKYFLAPLKEFDRL